MELNWQDIFYITSSLAMLIVLVTFIWIMRLLLIISKQIKFFTVRIHELSNIVGNVKRLKKGITLNLLRFLLKIVDKGGQNE